METTHRAAIQSNFIPVTTTTQAPVTVIHDAPQAGKTPTLNMTPNSSTQNEFVKIMQRQTEITNMLVQQNLASSLPVRNIPIFDGDPLQYHSFMKSFESCVEAKTNNASDCLHFFNVAPGTWNTPRTQS